MLVNMCASVGHELVEEKTYVSPLMYQAVWLITLSRQSLSHLLYFNPKPDEAEQYFESLNIISQDVFIEDPFFSNLWRDKSNPLVSIRGDEHVLNWLLEKTKSKIRQSSIEDRVGAIASLSEMAQPNRASLILTLLNRDLICPGVCSTRAPWGTNLLNCLSWAFGEYFFHEQADIYSVGVWHEGTVRELRSGGSNVLQEVISLTTELVRHAGSDGLHCIGKRFGIYQTPLLGLLRSFAISSYSEWPRYAVWVKTEAQRTGNYRFKTQYPSICQVADFVRTWLNVLDSCGVDLEEYGRKEKDVQKNEQVGNVVIHGYTVNDSYQWGDRGLMSSSFIFSYGPQVSDWQFWFIEQADPSFHEFWNMVEFPERGIPGAWNEDGEDSDVDLDVDPWVLGRRYVNSLIPVPHLQDLEWVYFEVDYWSRFVDCCSTVKFCTEDKGCSWIVLEY